MSVIDELITYRTADDVEHLKQLLRRGWRNMTVDEQSEFLTGLTPLMDANGEYLYDSNNEQLFVAGGFPLGAYNYTDLNRVETAVAYVAAELVQADTDLRAYAASLGVAWDSTFDLPYDPTDYTSLTTKTDWTDEDIMYVVDATRYIANLALIQAALPDIRYFAPDSMNGLDYEGANNIERMLREVDGALADEIERIKTLIKGTLGVYYSGEIYSGEVY